jgi:hypothetical protein
VKIENRYELIGITNAKEFEKSFNNIKYLVKNNEKSKVASYVSYPLNVNKEDKKIKIQSKEDFIKNYNSIITENVKKALLDQDVAKTFLLSTVSMLLPSELNSADLISFMVSTLIFSFLSLKLETHKFPSISYANIL